MSRRGGAMRRFIIEVMNLPPEQRRKELQMLLTGLASAARSTCTLYIQQRRAAKRFGYIEPLIGGKSRGDRPNLLG